MIGPILGAVAGIAGNLIGANAQKKAYEASVQNAQEQNRIAQENALRQEQLQRDFAQQGIQWKVADAKKAGLHPLFALGAQTHSYAPQSIGSASPDFSLLAQSGQSIGRAVDATRPALDKIGSFQNAIVATQLEGLQLDNDIKRATLASQLALGRTNSPGMPSDGVTAFGGQGDVLKQFGKVDGPEFEIKTKKDVADPRNPAYVPGDNPSVQMVKNTTGGYDAVIPSQLAEAYEADPYGTLGWTIRNRILPNFMDVTPPRPADGKGEYIFNASKQQWELVNAYGSRFGWGPSHTFDRR